MTCADPGDILLHARLPLKVSLPRRVTKGSGAKGETTTAVLAWHARVVKDVSALPRLKLEALRVSLAAVDGDRFPITRRLLLELVDDALYFLFDDTDPLKSLCATEPAFREARWSAAEGELEKEILSGDASSLPSVVHDLHARVPAVTDGLRLHDGILYCGVALFKAVNTVVDSLSTAGYRSITASKLAKWTTSTRDRFSDECRRAAGEAEHAIGLPAVGKAAVDVTACVAEAVAEAIAAYKESGLSGGADSQTDALYLRATLDTALGLLDGPLRYVPFAGGILKTFAALYGAYSKTEEARELGQSAVQKCNLIMSRLTDPMLQTVVQPTLKGDGTDQHRLGVRKQTYLLLVTLQKCVELIETFNSLSAPKRFASGGMVRQRIQSYLAQVHEQYVELGTTVIMVHSALYAADREKPLPSGSRGVDSPIETAQVVDDTAGGDVSVTPPSRLSIWINAISRIAVFNQHAFRFMPFFVADIHEEELEFAKQYTRVSVATNATGMLRAYDTWAAAWNAWDGSKVIQQQQQQQQRGRRVLVEAPAGAGKSTVVKWVACNAHELTGIRAVIIIDFALLERYLFSRSEYGEQHRDRIDWLAEVLHVPSYGAGIPLFEAFDIPGIASAIELYRDQLVIVFDGFDEIQYTKCRLLQLLITSLHDPTNTQWPHVVVTTRAERVTRMGEVSELFAGFDRMSLQLWDEKLEAHYCNHFPFHRGAADESVSPNGSNGSSATRRDPGDAQLRACEAIRILRGEDFDALGGLPVVVHLVCCIVHLAARDDLNVNIITATELFSRLIDFMFEWPVRRSLQHDDLQNPDIALQVKEALARTQGIRLSLEPKLSRIAFDHSATGRFKLAIDEFAQLKPSSLLVRVSPLAADGSATYRFLHKSVTDYLAGKALATTQLSEQELVLHFAANHGVHLRETSLLTLAADVLVHAPPAADSSQPRIESAATSALALMLHEEEHAARKESTDPKPLLAGQSWHQQLEKAEKLGVVSVMAFFHVLGRKVRGAAGEAAASEDPAMQRFFLLLPGSPFGFEHDNHVLRLVRLWYAPLFALSAARIANCYAIRHLHKYKFCGERTVRAASVCALISQRRSSVAFLEYLSQSAGIRPSLLQAYELNYLHAVDVLIDAADFDEVEACLRAATDAKDWPVALKCVAQFALRAGGSDARARKSAVHVIQELLRASEFELILSPRCDVLVDLFGAQSYDDSHVLVLIQPITTLVATTARDLRAALVSRLTRCKRVETTLALASAFGNAMDLGDAADVIFQGPLSQLQQSSAAVSEFTLFLQVSATRITGLAHEPDKRGSTLWRFDVSPALHISTSPGEKPPAVTLPILNPLVLATLRSAPRASLSPALRALLSERLSSLAIIGISGGTDLLRYLQNLDAAFIDAADVDEVEVCLRAATEVRDWPFALRCIEQFDRRAGGDERASELELHVVQALLQDSEFDLILSQPCALLVESFGARTYDDPNVLTPIAYAVASASLPQAAALVSRFTRCKCVAATLALASAFSDALDLGVAADVTISGPLSNLMSSVPLMACTVFLHVNDARVVGIAHEPKKRGSTLWRVEMPPASDRQLQGDDLAAPLGDGGLMNLGFPVLNELRFACCSRKKSGTTLLDAIINGSPALAHISVCHGVLTDTGLDKIGRRSAPLESLTLRAPGKAVADDSLVRIAERNPRLRALRLSHSSHISKRSIQAFTFAGPFGTLLKTVSFNNVPRVDNACLRLISTRLPHLEDLELVRLPAISDSVVKTMVVRSLRRLTIRQCPRVSDAALAHMTALNPQLTRLIVDDADAWRDKYLWSSVSVGRVVTRVESYSEFTKERLFLRTNLDSDADGADLYADAAYSLGPNETMRLTDGRILTKQALYECAIKHSSARADLYVSLADSLPPQGTTVLADGRVMGKRDLCLEAIKLDAAADHYVALSKTFATDDQCSEIARQRQLKDAMRDAVACNPERADLYALLADELIPNETVEMEGKGQMNRNELYLAAIAVNPWDASLYVTLANSLSEGETVTMADGTVMTRRQLYGRAVEVNPRDVNLHATHALSYVSPDSNFNSIARRISMATSQKTLVAALGIAPEQGDLYIALAGTLLSPSDTVTISGGLAMNKKQLHLAAIDRQPRCAEWYEALATLLNTTETATLLDGRVMNKTQLRIAALHYQSRNGKRYVDLASALKPGETAALPDGGVLSKTDLLVAALHCDPRNAQRYADLAHALRPGEPATLLDGRVMDEDRLRAAAKELASPSVDAET
jgi:hypothetical protein